MNLECSIGIICGKTFNQTEDNLDHYGDLAPSIEMVKKGFPEFRYGSRSTSEAERHERYTRNK